MMPMKNMRIWCVSICFISYNQQRCKYVYIKCLFIYLYVRFHLIMHIGMDPDPYKSKVFLDPMDPDLLPFRFLLSESGSQAFFVPLGSESIEKKLDSQSWFHTNCISVSFAWFIVLFKSIFCPYILQYIVKCNTEYFQIWPRIKYIQIVYKSIKGSLKH